ncbi:MAG: transposase [Candidatus Latescibacterota bacterium]
MRTVRDPRQTRFFDPFDAFLTERTRQALLEDWPGLFRHVLLELMPVEKLGEPFHPLLGRPTKELYSMAGLLVIKEFMNWTEGQALTAYRFHSEVHYALNLEPHAQDLSLRTLERYAQRFVEEELAGQVMHDVTTTLVRECGVRVEQQRLDSTHVFSAMASFGRTRMMGVTVKRFLTQVQRHDPAAYESLDAALRERYAPAVGQRFAGRGQDDTARHVLRQQVAEDMDVLIERFGSDPRHRQRSTYQMLERVFYEQCEVTAAKVVVKAKTGGEVVQNPSDPEATYDAHKGQGYQLQTAETCDPDNPVQLITAALPQTAAASDMAALEAVLDELEDQQRLPETLLADAGYGSDENVVAAQERGVELVSPTQQGVHESRAHTAPQTAGEKGIDTDAAALADTASDTLTGAADVASDALRATRADTAPQTDKPLTLADFTIVAETETVVRCPAGHAPLSSTQKRPGGATTTRMPPDLCGACAALHRCPVRQVRGSYRLQHTAKQRRLAVRRRVERSEAFRQRYRRRAGSEGTNSGLKRRLGLGQLRVRGQPRVSHALRLRVAGWNILRAVVCPKLRERVAQRAQSATLVAFSIRLGMWIRHSRRGRSPRPSLVVGCRAAGLICGLPGG